MACSELGPLLCSQKVASKSLSHFKDGAIDLIAGSIGLSFVSLQLVKKAFKEELQSSIAVSRSIRSKSKCKAIQKFIRIGGAASLKHTVLMAFVVYTQVCSFGFSSIEKFDCRNGAIACSECCRECRSFHSLWLLSKGKLLRFIEDIC